MLERFNVRCLRNLPIVANQILKEQMLVPIRKKLLRGVHLGQVRMALVLLVLFDALLKELLARLFDQVSLPLFQVSLLKDNFVDLGGVNV